MDSSKIWEPNISYTGVGNYLVRLLVLDSSGCEDTFAQSVRVGYNISVIDAKGMDASKVLNGKLQIIIPELEKSNLSLYDASGRLVYVNAENQGIAMFKGREGVYFYTLQFDTISSKNNQIKGRIFIQQN